MSPESPLPKHQVDLLDARFAKWEAEGRPTLNWNEVKAQFEQKDVAEDLKPIKKACENTDVSSQAF